MELVITIRMDNAAFGEDGCTRWSEVDRILRKMLADMSPLEPDEPVALFDSNGNKVGDYEIEE